MSKPSNPDTPLLRILVGQAGVVRVEGAKGADEREAAFQLCAKVMPEIERLNRAARRAC